MTIRQPSRTAICRACKSPQFLTVAGAFYRHATCAGSGLMPSEVEERVRTFHDWDSAYLDGSRDRDACNWQRTVEVVDNGDSVSLRAKVTVRSGPSSSWDVADVDVRIRPEDTRALIAELTAIAELRGL